MALLDMLIAKYKVELDRIQSRMRLNQIDAVYDQGGAQALEWVLRDLQAVKRSHR